MGAQTTPSGSRINKRGLCALVLIVPTTPDRCASSDFRGPSTSGACTTAECEFKNGFLQFSNSVKFYYTTIGKCSRFRRLLRSESRIRTCGYLRILGLAAVAITAMKVSASVLVSLQPLGSLQVPFGWDIANSATGYQFFRRKRVLLHQFL